MTNPAPKIVVTSALPYANGPIHIGHLVEYIQTDVYVRYLRLCGKSAIYCCAGDTHGAPIEINAKNLGITPEELVAKFLKEHQEDFAKYHIAFDSYYSTNSDENRYFAEKIYAELKKQGHIYEKELELTYCEHDKRFLPDRYVKGTCPKCGAKDQYGDVCEKCNAAYTTVDLIDPYCTLCKNKPIRKTSKHFFFKLSNFSEFLRHWLTANERLQPEIRNQILNWIEQGLNDWCISRDGPYFGFRIPGTEKYFYVWLDAPIGYISSLAHYLGGDKELAEQVWNSAEVQHFIGKDIIYFHLLFWPAVLHAAKLKVPENIIVHGHLTVDGEKMSKSRGTFLTAKEFAEKIPDTEFLRFYYAANLSHAMTDIDLNLHDFTERVNKELVSNVANFIYRTLSFIEKNYGSKLGTKASDDKAQELIRQVIETEQRALQSYDEYEFRRAVQEIFRIASLGNAYLQEASPWKDPENGLPVLTICASIVKDLSILLAPILPGFSRKVQEQLGLTGLSFKDIGFTLQNRPIGKPAIIWTRMEEISFHAKPAAHHAAKKDGSSHETHAHDAKSHESHAHDAKSHDAKTHDSKTHVTKTHEPHSHDAKAHDANDAKVHELKTHGENTHEGNAHEVKVHEGKIHDPHAHVPKSEKTDHDVITPAILDLIVAKIVKVERHPQAEKLYIETLDDGSGEERVIVSGLVPYYKEDELLHKHIILVNNLKPAKLRGVMSHGMLLAAQDEGAVEVLEAPHAKPGTPAEIEGFERGTKEISVDEFFQLKFFAENHHVTCNGSKVMVHDKQLRTKMNEGKVA